MNGECPDGHYIKANKQGVLCCYKAPKAPKAKAPRAPKAPKPKAPRAVKEPKKMYSFPKASPNAPHRPFISKPLPNNYKEGKHLYNLMKRTAIVMDFPELKEMADSSKTFFESAANIYFVQEMYEQCVYAKNMHKRLDEKNQEILKKIVKQKLIDIMKHR